MDIQELIRENRSIRTFDESIKLTREELISFADCARLSASAANKQVLKYRIVYKESEVEALFPLTKWAGYLTELQLPPKGHHPTAYVVICHDTSIDSSISAFQKDVGIAAQSITLAATAQGYGCCMIGSFDAGKTAEVLGLCENLKPQLIIAIGKGEELAVICNPKDGDIKYFRDKAGVHFVPKRPIEEVVIE